VEPMEASGACASGGSKRPSGMNILSAKSVKLSKGIVPCTIASTATCDPENLHRASGCRAIDAGPSSRATHGTKKAAPSTKKCIVLAIGALAVISLKGTQESLQHDQVPEVQSKAGPHGQYVEPQARSPMSLWPRPIPNVSLPISTSVGAGGASTGHLRFLKNCVFH
jgi:hypothetical protein